MRVKQTSRNCKWILTNVREIFVNEKERHFKGFKMSLINQTANYPIWSATAYSLASKN